MVSSLKTQDNKEEEVKGRRKGRKEDNNFGWE